MSKKVNLRSVKARFLLFYRKTVTFLQSKISRESLIFLFFVMLSFSFWMMLSLNDTVESNFKVPVRYVVPDKMIVTAPLPEKLDVRLRDKGTVLLGYWAQGLSEVQFDLSRFENERGMAEISDRQLQQHIRKQLAPSTELTVVQPDSIPLYYTLSAGRKMPVEVRSRITAALQCVADSVIGLDHDSVMVYAPPQILDRIDKIYTDTLVAEELSDTLRTELTLRPIEGAKFVPDVLQATVYVEEVTLKQFDIPISVRNLPAQYAVITFPPQVRLSCLVPLSRFAALAAEEFAVSIDFDRILKHSGKKQPVDIDKMPFSAMNVQIVPDSVEYIIEDRLSW